MSAAFAQLGAVAEFINGAAFGPEDWSESGAPIIRIQNLTDPSKPYNRTTRVVAEKLRVQPGELLVSWSATLGVFEWKGPDEGLLNQHIFRVVPDERKVDKRYLRHGLELAIIDMQRHLHGATMRHVNRHEFLSTRLYLPPLAEQRRIAGLLDQAEALRAKRRSALIELSTLTQALFLETFVTRNRFPSEALDSICDLITDGTHYTPTYSDTGVIFLSSGNVTSGYVDWNDVMFVPESLHTELHRRVAPRVNDILLAKNGTTGVAAIVDRDCVFDIYVSLALLRPSARVLPSFLREAINSPACTRQFNTSLKGIGVPNLHLKEIRKTTIPVPPIGLQREFARIVASVERLKGGHRASLNHLDALFVAAQQRAFLAEL